MYLFFVSVYTLQPDHGPSFMRETKTKYKAAHETQMEVKSEHNSSCSAKTSSYHLHWKDTVLYTHTLKKINMIIKGKHNLWHWFKPTLVMKWRVFVLTHYCCSAWAEVKIFSSCFLDPFWEISSTVLKVHLEGKRVSGIREGVE